MTPTRSAQTWSNALGVVRRKETCVDDQDHMADATHGPDLLFAGEIYCDMVFAGAEVPETGGEVFADGFILSPGGVANRAVAAARVGAHAGMLARIGSDRIGGAILSMLAQEDGLDMSGVTVAVGRQSPVSVSVTDSRNRSFISYHEELGPSEPPRIAGPIRAIHLGIAQELPAWVSAWRAAGTKIVGGVGWDATGEWSREVMRRLAEVDVFILNEVEALRYTRSSDVLTAAKELAERVPLVVVTRGERGAVAVDAARRVIVEVPCVSVPVVDTTGAGDVFTATFMTAMLQDWALPEQLRFASLCASLSVMGLGGAVSAPRSTEVGEFIRARHSPGDWSFLADLEIPDGGR